MVIVRDVVIVSGALAYTALIGKVDPAPTVISKLNTAFQLLYILIVIAHEAFGLPTATVVLVVGAGVLFTSVVSGPKLCSAKRIVSDQSDSRVMSAWKNRARSPSESATRQTCGPNRLEPRHR